MTTRITIPLAMIALALAASKSPAATVTLIDETFTSGSSVGTTWTSSAVGVSNGQQWAFVGLDGTTATATEMWAGTGGASARGLSTTYDHDNNGGTAAINIPGGVEVMSGFTSNGLPDTMRVGVQITLPALLDDGVDGTLTFFAANRLAGGFGGQAPLVSVRNLTDNRDILALTTINYPGGTVSAKAWNLNTVLLNFIAADAGDLIEVRFQESITTGGSSGARGLNVADVTLTAEVLVVPTPTALPAGLAMIGLALIRRRR